MDIRVLFDLYSVKRITNDQLFKPFDGISVILFGDFAQLPPVCEHLERCCYDEEMAKYAIMTGRCCYKLRIVILLMQ